MTSSTSITNGIEVGRPTGREVPSSAAHTAGWLAGNGGIAFQQFAAHRINRRAFPLGGYVYEVIDSPDTGTVHYTGNSYDAARTAIAKATGAP